MTDELTAAVARLRGCLGVPAQWGTDVRLVLAALEAAQKDAARYRWFRDAPGIGLDYICDHWLNPNGSMIPGSRLDAAIDAAMKGEKGEGDA